MSEANTSGDSKPMRIVSLLPSITEIVAALGLGPHLVGITHECDYPPEVVKDVKVVTSSDIQPYKMSQAEINKLVSGSLANGHSLYGLGEAELKDVNPTHVFTQALCDVCAVSYPKVLSTCARVLGDGPRVVSLEPTDFEEVFTTITVMGEQCGVQDRAEALKAELREQIARIKAAVAAKLEENGGKRPKLAFLEWNDPLFTGGHWVPDMCAMAGADYTMAKSGERSVQIEKEKLIEYDPDVILVAPCGFDTKRACDDAKAMYQHQWWKDLRAVKNGDVYAADANSFFARPGPRIVPGTAVVAQILHGIDVGLVPEGAWVKVEAP